MRGMICMSLFLSERCLLKISTAASYMINKISVSQNGGLCCGSTFVDSFSGSTRCTFSYVHPNANGESFDSVKPDFTVFSRCSSIRSAHRMSKKDECTSKKYHKAGDHVALCYNGSGSFFSILVLRCDTWSVLWAVASLPESMRICKVELLDAHLMCGLASVNSNQCRLFIGSRFNCKYISERKNRSLRHFIAEPQFIELGSDNETIIAIVTASANSIFALSESGSLYFARFEHSFNGQSLNWTITKKVIVDDKMRRVSKGTEMILSRNDESNTLVVFSQECTTLDVISFTTDYENPNYAVNQIIVPRKFWLRRVEFVGSYYFVITLEECSSHTPAFQFVSFFSSAEGMREFVQHEVLPLKKVPVASFFSAETEEHFVVCTNMSSWSSTLEGDLDIESLVQTKFTFSNGPYSSKIVDAAVWNSFFALHDTHQDLSRLENAADDLHGILSLVAPEDTNAATSLRLFYALLNSNESGASEVGVFCVDALPYIHNRLVKQFHNATQGLRQLLLTRSPIKQPFLLSWNPRHLRRALRLLSQEQVGALFHDIAKVMRSPATGSIFGASTYSLISTAGCSMAMHIITLSKQMGVVLNPKDTEILSALFRSSREISHECLGYFYRMKLILESCAQQRRLNNLLYIGQERIDEISENEGNDSTQNINFFPTSNDIRLSRALQTRYDINSWANNLQKNVSHHIEIEEADTQYITEACSFNSCNNDEILSDWQFLGREPNLDATFNQFESTLIAAALPEKGDDK